MVRSLREILRSLYGRIGGSEADEDGGFRPSLLDRSVRIAHGGPDREIERELQELAERAGELEDTRREE
jgi:hypothetical protein